MTMLTRRELLIGSLAGAATLGLGDAQAQSWPIGERLRGFNFTQKMHPESSTAYPERDFELIARWGFNFVRLPTNYRVWTNPDGSYKQNELLGFDEAVTFGRRHGIHVCLAFHDAPGYEHQTGAAEDTSLLDPATAGDATGHFVALWNLFAERYRHVPARNLSFNLLNEPHGVSTKGYIDLVRRTVAAIRSIDPNRPIIADGWHWGEKPVPELADLDVGQSARGYFPRQITNFGMRPPDADPTWPMPRWPTSIDGQRWDKDHLKNIEINPWVALQKRGVFVHVGEFGIFYEVPADVAYPWLQDQLQLWRDAGFGWAMWSLSNGFGILDNHRQGAKMDILPDGRQLDRGMLELMQSI